MKIFIFLLLGSLLMACSTNDSKPNVQSIEPETDTYAKTYYEGVEAVALADEQLEAYNNRDLEAFLLPYAGSVQVFNSLHEFGYQGKEAMRENYASWFDQLDTIHCDVINRIATGNTVVEHEKIIFKIKGQSEMRNFEAIAIYKTAAGKIQEVHFVRPDNNQ